MSPKLSPVHIFHLKFHMHFSSLPCVLHAPPVSCFIIWSTLHYDTDITVFTTVVMAGFKGERPGRLPSTDFIETFASLKSQTCYTVSYYEK
jgi:hypothetical protein